MIVGCDHGPNSQALHDFAFRDFMFQESMLYYMLKPQSHEITISWIRCHEPIWIRWPRWISTFRDFGPSTFWDSRNMCIPHSIFPKMNFSMVRIWCHTSCWIRQLLLIPSFVGSDLLQITSTTFRTLDSYAYYLPSISEFWHENSFAQLALL